MGISSSATRPGPVLPWAGCAFLIDLREHSGPQAFVSVVNNLSQVVSGLCFSLFQKFTNQFRGRRKSCRARVPGSGSGQESRTARVSSLRPRGAAGDLGAGGLEAPGSITSPRAPSRGWEGRAGRGGPAHARCLDPPGGHLRPALGPGDVSSMGQCCKTAVPTAATPGAVRVAQTDLRISGTRSAAQPVSGRHTMAVLPRLTLQKLPGTKCLSTLRRTQAASGEGTRGRRQPLGFRSHSPAPRCRRRPEGPPPSWRSGGPASWSLHVAWHLPGRVHLCAHVCVYVCVCRPRTCGCAFVCANMCAHTPYVGMCVHACAHVTAGVTEV